ncbi:MAG: DUF4097 family beta strand repeat-containing protein [Acidimicrobiales bacterium]
MEWTFEASDPVDVDVVVPSGVVEIEASVAGAVSVVLEPMSGRASRAEALIAESDVSLSSGTLRVHVPNSLSAVRHAAVRCHLRVPEDSAVRVTTASADVSCAMQIREFSGTSASGDVDLRAVRGDVSLRSASGDVRCESIGGKLRVRAASGDVHVGAVGRDVNVSLASGGLVVADAGGSVDVKTASGDVSVGCARTGTVRVQSASGDVTVGVASGVGATLDVSSVSGDATCDLPFEEESPSAAELKIICRTVSGDVRVRSATPVST